MSNDKVVELRIARFIPSWMLWAGLGVVCGLAIAWREYPSDGIVWALSVIGCVLVYLVFLVYNQFAKYYNDMQIRQLELSHQLDQVIEHITCTFQYEDGADMLAKLDGTKRAVDCLTKEGHDE